MSTLETESPPLGSSPASAATSASTDVRTVPTTRGKGGSIFRKLLLLLVVGAAAGGGYYYLTEGGKKPFDAQVGLNAVLKLFHGKAEAAPLPSPGEVKERPAWDGLVTVTADEEKSIALEVVPVKSQTEPIKLELTGRTAYNENTLNRVRPRFDTLVERVLVEKGQHVKKGDPLVDLHSTDLAKAKNEYQTNYVQWLHDLRLVKLREPLVRTGAISQQTWVDTQNDENKSRLLYMTSRENLVVLGVPEEEIDPLIADLGESPDTDQKKLQKIQDKAKLTFRSHVDGIVIQRDVVAGNLYDNSNVLMVIAPLNELWVWVNVYERDQGKVALGQRMVIQFPFLEQPAYGKVEFVASEVSRESRAVQARASIPNPGGRLKSDMLVKAALEIPPVQGQTVVPRLAMVVINGDEYVFVRKSSSAAQGIDKFERRKVVVTQENSDFVVIASGLDAGEMVATSGSLILAQLYEDLQMVATGMPAQ
jgi:cobalt-zinc-cadmium efflux system membrane fusion protein